MSLSPPLVATAVLLLALLPTACGAQESGPPAGSILAFHPSEEPVQTSSETSAAVRIGNDGGGTETFWVGLSTRSAAGGRWRDAPPVPVELEPGERAEARLRVPALAAPGYHNARVSVWSGRPGEGGATRLDSLDQASAFRAHEHREGFDGDGLDDGWRATGHLLGRGKLLPRNVSVGEGSLRLRLPADSLEGAEARADGRRGPGFYAARIKAPDAPSSITGFFLYQEPDLESEIDVEVFNDRSRTVLFTTYAGGKQTRTETMRLPFDPTRGFHDYAFLYENGSVTFYVDGEAMRTFEGGVPEGPMGLYVNAWYPTWLAGERPAADGEVLVDWVEYPR